MFTHVRFFKELTRHDIPQVGGKGANLGEMYSHGFPVPPGFVVTAQAYFAFLEETSLTHKIATVLKNIDVNNTKKLQKAADTIQTAILAARMPDDIAKEIKEAYIRISGNSDASVAVRSSATAEDLPDASFAGQQETYLDVVGAKHVLTAVQRCWASLFGARAIFYRDTQGYSHFKVGIAVPVQRMVESDVSGIMFTVDPVTSVKSNIVIEAGFGLGQPLVSGELVPDQYLVSKEDFSIHARKIVTQPWAFINNKQVKLPSEKGSIQKLDDRHISELAKLGAALEKHYGHPQDVEWAMEGKRLYIVQTRPITTISTKKTTQTFTVPESHIPLLDGLSASPGYATGPVRIVKSVKELSKVKEGDVLVAVMTDPDYVPAMERAVAIITNAGGRTSHASIVSRELGIVCVVGTEHATALLKNGEIVTVDGTHGRVYAGNIVADIHVKNTKVQQTDDLKTATKVYVNLAEPQHAFDIARQHVDGVGLLRAEFMIGQIGVHPRLMIEQGKSDEFVAQLVSGLESFCAAFYPRPIIYRATDFKTNEYRSLKGGEEYEPVEPNPMLGYRGCFRYISEGDVFDLELTAIKQVREKYKNLHVMIPFVHTVEELKAVKKIMNKAQVKRSASFQLYMMVEIPSNVILLDDFIAEGIDGVSIGSNDLTMTILGVDRDNPKVASVYDERNPAVMWAFEKTITTARKAGISVSMCGQAPSVYPELTKKLVEWGITAVSVNPDVIDSTRRIVHTAEKELIAHKTKRRT